MRASTSLHGHGRCLGQAAHGPRRVNVEVRLLGRSDDGQQGSRRQGAVEPNLAHGPD